MIEFAAIADELLVFALIGVSGAGIGIMTGWRHPVLLAAFAVLFSGAVRVITTLLMWSFGAYQLITEAWWLASGLIAATTVVFVLRKKRGEILPALAIFGGMVGVSLVTKYVFRIGERHHRDSVSAVETALLLFQGELSPLEWPPEEKRGLVYPLMLALGGDGRLLVGLTPVIFLSLVLAAAWLAYTVIAPRWSEKAWWLSVVIVAAFSLTVPIIRVAYTYLNAHTFVALGLLAIVLALIMSNRAQSLTPATIVLASAGSIVATTARVEAIIMVGVMLLALASRPWITGIVNRIGVFFPFALAGLTLSWWLGVIDSEVPASYGVTAWLAALVAVVVAALIASPVIDRIRRYLFVITIAAVALIMIAIPLASGNPLPWALAQFNNVVRGYGGWGIAGPAFFAIVAVLGWRRRSPEYRQIAALTIVVIFLAPFSQLFDGGFGGGFGRDGFYDSVNRMWLHSLGLAVSTLLIGLTEFFRDVAQRVKPQKASNISNRD
jgi:hypothetical protein